MEEMAATSKVSFIYSQKLYFVINIIIARGPPKKCRVFSVFNFKLYRGLMFLGGPNTTRINSTWGSRGGKYAGSVEWLSFIQCYQSYLVLVEINSKKD